ncbi:MAG: hypothetical protein GY778_21770 [bacterium]|nr:hypothetical protein [bacterium]
MAVSIDQSHRDISACSGTTTAELRRQRLPQSNDEHEIEQVLDRGRSGGPQV